MTHATLAFWAGASFGAFVTAGVALLTLAILAKAHAYEADTHAERETDRHG